MAKLTYIRGFKIFNHTKIIDFFLRREDDEKVVVKSVTDSVNWRFTYYIKKGYLDTERRKTFVETYQQEFGVKIIELNE